MLNAKSFLAVDFGAANLKLAEFQLTEDGGLMLTSYDFKALGQEGTQEATRETAMQRALQELQAQGRYTSKNLSICAPGFHTFSKFVKLPPVDTSKVTQIIQYEAQQNVPFPLEEVVWDYQILGANATGELEVLLVAIKSDIVESLFRVAENSGLRLQLVDVSPAALCNAFRYNYSDLDGCSMLLDIGAKSSNLLFFDKSNVYSRGINIGANSITQEFAKEAKLSLADAERLKIDEGFVSLGGAYEEPDNPQQAQISKIARQVLTRLHIQVNQTIQFYRGQQGGSTPQRLFLSGGASIMPYTAQFFSEKLNLPAEAVEYLNPFRYVQIADHVNREELAKVAHNLGEVVGLGLRNLAHCPVELNLMPKSSLKRQQLNQRKPYFVASAACTVMLMFAAGWFYNKVAAEKQDALEKIEKRIQQLQPKQAKLKNILAELRIADTNAGFYASLLEDRLYWGSVLARIRETLITVEQQKEQELKTKTGIWVERLTPVLPEGIISGSVPPQQTNVVATLWSTSTSTNRPSRNPVGASSPRFGGGPVSPKDPSNPAAGVELSSVVLQLRGVTGNSDTKSAPELADAVAKALQSETNYFDPRSTELMGKIIPDPSDLTFTFEVTLKLKRPVKF